LESIICVKDRATLFESSHRFFFFDYFRVPYVVRPEMTMSHHADSPLTIHQLRTTASADGAPRTLLWPRTGEDTAATVTTCQPGRYQLNGFTFFGHVAADVVVADTLSQLGRGWHPAEHISDSMGQRRAAVWRDGEGGVFLPFDPAEVMHQFWSEKYRKIGTSPMVRRAHATVLRGYYLVRPALPRWMQLRLRRVFTRVQAKSSFPDWPNEDSLHTLYAWLFSLLAELAGEPVPFIDPWPYDKSWALVLTHDVETDSGCRNLDLLRAPERQLGYRSSWNFVPLRYTVADETIRALQAEGCEVGVHGLRHDGRDLGSRRLLAKRLPRMREYADRWQAAGFRAPATQRRWEWMPRLGFDYDSSYSDTDPYEPQPGGCCSYLPYFNEDLVELPITLPQDHTLFSILQRSDAEVWIQKAEFLRERGGMVLILTHPDYAGDPRVTTGYRSLLGRFCDDDSVWRALPREAAAWWRQRASSTVRADGSGWRIEGPAAASGRIRFATADSWAETTRGN
jgi:hypothetical protein